MTWLLQGICILPMSAAMSLASRGGIAHKQRQFADLPQPCPAACKPSVCVHAGLPWLSDAAWPKQDAATQHSLELDAAAAMDWFKQYKDSVGTDPTPPQAFAADVDMPGEAHAVQDCCRS